MARSVTLRATVPMHTALEAATATAAVTAAEAAARVARLATLVAAMATCPVSEVDSENSIVLIWI